jgi:hypothetical protein
VFVQEAKDGVSPPASHPGAWFGLDAIASLCFAESHHQQIVEDWLAQLPTSKAVPYSTAGGYEEAFDWMFSQCKQQGLVPKRVEQIKDAYVSAVFRCVTDQGDLYLKILPGIFIRELEVTRALARWGILDLPQWLAFDPDRNYILMKDMGGCDLTDCCDLETLRVVFRQLAEYQIASVSCLQSAVPAPFYDWRLPVLADRLALSLVNRQQVKAKGFTATDTGAVLMDEATRKEVLVAWQKRKQEEIHHPFLDEKIALGLLPYVQATLLARHLRGDLDGYPAFFWK